MHGCGITWCHCLRGRNPTKSLVLKPVSWQYTQNHRMYSNVKSQDYHIPKLVSSSIKIQITWNEIGKRNSLPPSVYSLM